MKDFEGKTAIVTGGAEGIGRAIATKLAERGAAVGIADLNLAKARETGHEITSGTGAKVSVAECDIKDEAAVRAAVDSLVGALGAPSVLVNNAAINHFRGIDATPEDWRLVMDVNVMGGALMAKHVVPHMRKAGGGSIVNMASISAVIAQKDFLTYNASKAAVVAASRCLAYDLVEDGIRVNSVCPGATLTEGVRKVIAERGLTVETAAREPNLGLEHMFDRLAEPEEIAAAVVFLASEEASFITGSNLMADGGWSAI
jgi:NAD(P)-dependent dehydrogenase (short-subunit alcohol dehydrogenase family)